MYAPHKVHNFILFDKVNNTRSNATVFFKIKYKSFKYEKKKKICAEKYTVCLLLTAKKIRNRKRFNRPTAR